MDKAEILKNNHHIFTGWTLAPSLDSSESPKNAGPLQV